MHFFLCVFFFFKQKTAYEMRISDWSSDVCSSDLSCFGKRAGDCTRPTSNRHQRPGPESVDKARILLRCRQLPAASAAAFRLHGGRAGRFRTRSRYARRTEGPCCGEMIKIGSAWCRERVCKYVEISEGAVALTNIKKTN